VVAIRSHLSDLSALVPGLRRSHDALLRGSLAVYQFWAKPAVEHLAPGASMPARAKVTGALSLIIWIAVAACGRSIAYF
jgi:hypothetical protein